MESHEERDRLEQQDRADGVQRRQFLQLLGGSFAAMALPACDFRAPREKIVPYLEQPEEIVPGVAAWYATTCRACPAGCGMLVKCRDGRPIKAEGNPEHPVSVGGLCARGQASVLDLYDSERLRGPLQAGEATTWAYVDDTVGKALAAAEAKGGGVRILSRTVTGPSMLAAIQALAAKWPSARHVQYDSPCASPILEAHRMTHGTAVLPWYRFEKARAIVSLEADFLGTWISPVEFTHAWAAGRRIGKDLTALPWHAQIEARMSVTGANADLRVPLAPSRHLAAALEIAARVAARLGNADVQVPPPAQPSGVDGAILDRIAGRLAADPGRSLVVSGSPSVAVQCAVNVLNQALGNYGSTLDVTQPSLQCQGTDEAFSGLIDEMNAGQVRALILLDANPGYEHPRAAEFLRALEKVDFSVSLAARRNETASRCHLVAPDHHAFESWADAHPHVGVYGLCQPTIAPLWGTRSALESILAWAGVAAGAHEWLQQTWKDQLFVKQDVHVDFQAFWDKSLHDGVFVLPSELVPAPPGFRPQALERAVASAPAATNGDVEFVGFAGVALGNGDQANNPWLQELPDPLSKATWGNHASLSPRFAERLGVVEGRLLELSADGHSAKLPAHVQPGMPDGVIAAALGYGREGAGKIAANFPMEKMFAVDKELCGGADVYPFLRSGRVRVRVLDGMDSLAKTQTYDLQVTPLTRHERPLVLHMHVADLAKATAAKKEEAGEAHGSLWKEHEYPGDKWEMAIDLNACTGCSACVVACGAENNVPVVGKSEIRKARDMFWIRLDRYYDAGPDGSMDNPEVGFMPMLCQHCDKAPCETVCPALATLHSSDGLNMQVYNRCVGTRYCANNCPYKVRRFNWFDYAHQDLLQNLVLNPDVAVRSRGVMEKCSFCVQRIVEARVHARGEGRPILDGEVKPACVQSCPSAAIAFGNANDPRSQVAKWIKDPRAYTVLDEIGTGPSVHYLKRVRNEA